ncbi:MAG TPA: FecR domain-containing protein [Candidatus Didemnitutus sp.]|nr:FecR domain-containing protein [Candidatus Didemnitutus sp.]
MSTNPANHPEAIESRAAEFLAQRDGGWSFAEAAEFARWRLADAQHDAAVRRLEAAQRLLRRLPESPAAAAMLSELDALQLARRKVVAFHNWLKVGGALAAAACVALVVWVASPRLRSSASFSTAAGQHRTVDLTDGSTLLLNNGSEVDVDFRSSERRVNLHQGEVHFSVAKDASRPFIVAAGSVRVRAVGTAFNVRRDQTAIEVVVTEGKVQVSRADTAALDPVYLVAGESTTVNTDGSAPLAVARINSDDVRAKLAWQAPRLVFSDTALADAVARFNRYSKVQLEIGDPELASLPVGGGFDADKAEEFANILLAAGGVKLERVSDTHIILRKPR